MINSSHLEHVLFRGFETNLNFQPCSDWSISNHFFIQLANLFILLALCFCCTGIYSLLYLRSMILIANLITLLWIWLVSCQIDLLFWNGCFVFINALHIIVILCKLHLFIRFPHEVEMAYRNLFQPLGVSRYNFKKLYSCTRCIQILKPKDIYAMENQTIIDKLSLILAGRVSVVRNGVTCHIIDCFQFLESPEWFGMNTAETSQVSFIALEESQILVWNRDKLKLSISSDRYLQTILDHILGKDIVKKLMLSLDIDSAMGVPISEKTKLMKTNYNLDHQILSLNTLKSRLITMFLESLFDECD
ncbi:Popeye domain-containing protein [Sarcoptes scabiei]|uniref:Popeye domain-containing protein n=1 Tax=Sarcoptes scabiei TaxID=52283 RepID=A0A132A263_SARSC|nr:Popeye domain-containing protein [Sarcoptes scabiei]